MGHQSGAECRGIAVNKAELIEHVATQADISKAAAGRAVDSIIGGVCGALQRGEAVTLSGFGTFAVSTRAAREGRNPRTGAVIQIRKSRTAKFRPGKTLREALT
jgi:DNA-binding protein HU-beta